MRQNRLNLTAILFLTIIFNQVLAAPNLINGKWIYSDCATCHGQNGEGMQITNSPRLAGLSDWYLTSQLEKFRTGLRGANPEDTLGAVMASEAKFLQNEQALADVVAYIGTLKASRPERTEFSGDPIQGKDTFCSRCHGTKGQGIKGHHEEPGAPRLSGQHDWYLIKQLHNFKAGFRGDLTDKGGLWMRAEAKTIHSDQDIKDIVAYIGTLE